MRDRTPGTHCLSMREIKSPFFIDDVFAQGGFHLWRSHTSPHLADMMGVKIPSTRTRAIGGLRRTCFCPTPFQDILFEVYPWMKSLKVDFERVTLTSIQSYKQLVALILLRTACETYLVGWAVWASKNTLGNMYGRLCKIIKTDFNVTQRITAISYFLRYLGK